MFLCLNNLCTSFVCTVNMCVWGVSLFINYTSGCLFGAKDDCSAFFFLFVVLHNRSGYLLRTSGSKQEMFK